MREPILGFVLGDGGKPASPRDYIYLYVYPSTLYRVRYTYIYPTAFTYEGFPSKTQLHVFPKLEALPFVAPHGYLQQAAHPPALTLPKELHKTRSRFPKPACNTKKQPKYQNGVQRCCLQTPHRAPLLLDSTTEHTKKKKARHHEEPRPFGEPPQAPFPSPATPGSP